MENEWKLEEQESLMNELVQGMELARQLKLNSTSSSESREVFVQAILSSYERALLILKWRKPVPPQIVVATGTGASSLPSSPISVNGSSQSDDTIDRGLKFNQSKKRKMLPILTEKVRVNSESGLEGPHEDGFSWRKYGQKDILGAKYPRSYYRCTFRNTQNCWAVKQVQRTDEDSSVFEITYRGNHTCSHGNHSVLSPPSPEKQDQKHTIHSSHHHYHQQIQSKSDFQLSDRDNQKINTENFENKEKEKASSLYFPSTSFENDTPLGTFSQFISPTTPELANSPFINLDFPLDLVQIDPDFPFYSSGFLF